MQIPPGYYQSAPRGSGYKLKKALYGLKQSPKWKFSTVMKSMGYQPSDGDHTLFVKTGVNGRIAVLLKYVDNIIVSGNDEEEICSLGQKLSHGFDIKSLGLFRYFFGIEITFSPEGIFTS